MTPALLSTSPVCATEKDMEMYNSKMYTAALIFHLFLAVFSLFLIVLAVRKLLMDSIITVSTRIFLVIGLLCCTSHQFGFIVLRTQVLYQTFFKLSDPCNLYSRTSDCVIVTVPMVSGNSGMVLIQAAMTVERIAATAMPRFWPKLKFWPGILLSGVMLICNYLLNDFIFWNEPFNEYVPTCGSLPSRSVPRFFAFLRFAFLISIANMVLQIAILYINVLQDRRQRLVTDDQSRSFNMNERFHSRETLKSSQAIFFLAMSQFLAEFLYTVSTDIILQNKERLNLTPLQSGLALALAYTTPYACIAIPSLIILTLRFIKNQRLRSIEALRKQTETGDEHMKKIQKIWDQ